MKVTVESYRDGPKEYYYHVHNYWLEDGVLAVEERVVGCRVIHYFKKYVRFEVIEDLPETPGPGPGNGD